MYPRPPSSRVGIEYCFYWGLLWRTWIEPGLVAGLVATSLDQKKYQIGSSFSIFADISTRCTRFSPARHHDYPSQSDYIEKNFLNNYVHGLTRVPWFLLDDDSSELYITRVHTHDNILVCFLKWQRARIVWNNFAGVWNDLYVPKTKIANILSKILIN